MYIRIDLIFEEKCMRVKRSRYIREKLSCALLLLQFMMIRVNRLHSSHPVIPITIQVNFVKAGEIDVTKDGKNRTLQKKNHVIIRHMIKVNAYESYIYESG